MSAQAIAAQGFRPAQDQNPKTAEAEQTGDGEADRQRGPPAPRGKPRIVTVDVGKHRPAQCNSCWMAARQGQPSHGTRRAGLVVPSQRPATCTLPPPTMAAAAVTRSLRHLDPPGHSQAAAAAPPKGHAAPPVCSPRQVQRPDPLDLGPPSRNPRSGAARLRQPRRAPRSRGEAAWERSPAAAGSTRALPGGEHRRRQGEGEEGRGEIPATVCGLKRQ